MNIKWKKTTLRKGTKSPKICRDMFITDSRGDLKLCEVSNGVMVTKKTLTFSEAKDIIGEHSLISTGSIFPNCFTYRDQVSTKLVLELLNN